MRDILLKFGRKYDCNSMQASLVIVISFMVIEGVLSTLLSTIYCKLNDVILFYIFHISYHSLLLLFKMFASVHQPLESFTYGLALSPEIFVD